MDQEKSREFIIDNFRFAKTELASTIENQYKILSLLVTATAAVFVYILDKDENEMRQLVFCSCLIVPGIYAFFGALWLDQVYRQRRLVAYIYRMEEYLLKPDLSGGEIEERGWEHFVQYSKRDRQKEKQYNRPSRSYYQICLGLFFCFPVVTFALACFFGGGNVFSFAHELHIPAYVGVCLYGAFVFYAIKYIRAIMGLAEQFHTPTPSDRQKAATDSSPAGK